LAALLAGTGSSSDRASEAKQGVTVTSHDGTFHAEFPSPPGRDEARETIGGLDLVVVTYSVGIDDGAVAVSYTDYPDVRDGRAVLDGAASGSASRVNGTITSNTTTTFLDLDARDVAMTVASGSVFERIFLDGNRLYIILAAGAGDRPVAYDRLVGSFALL
ncbi:MAG: hypothetical protein QOE93_1552, partial [Actinomycetota bacterium]|nr:hypothetical protein [Actinomycetota bacterium]